MLTVEQGRAGTSSFSELLIILLQLLRPNFPLRRVETPRYRSGSLESKFVSYFSLCRKRAFETYYIHLPNSGSFGG